jgi:hypothetical protein
MEKELGVDAAEGPLKESAHVIVPRTAANKIDLKGFIGEALSPHRGKDSIPVAVALRKERIKLGRSARFGA